MDRNSRCCFATLIVHTTVGELYNFYMLISDETSAVIRSLKVLSLQSEVVVEKNFVQIF